ncbi:hypothetical protein FBU30_006759, partial [Linnemannia zychae]
MPLEIVPDLDCASDACDSEYELSDAESIDISDTENTIQANNNEIEDTIGYEDALVRMQIEQLVRGKLEEMKKQWSRASKGSDVDTTTERDLQPHAGDSASSLGIPVDNLKDRVALRFNDVLLDDVREILYQDSCIMKCAQQVNVDPSERFKHVGVGVVEFQLSGDTFVDWRKQHEQRIATKFVLEKGEYYRDGADNKERVRSMICECAGGKREHKERKKGGISGKTRKSAPSRKTGCMAKIMMAWDAEKEFLSSVLNITYYYHHNH